jgi:uncharacterized protein YuzE
VWARDPAELQYAALLLERLPAESEASPHPAAPARRHGGVMFYRYDQMARALYVTLTDTPIEDSAELAPNVVADYAADGTLVGIEVLDVWPQSATEP